MISGKWKVEAMLSSRLSILLCILLVGFIFVWLRWREPASLSQPKETSLPTIDKQPVEFAIRTFDPASPPADMPPLPPGENAECDSNFASNASVGGQTRRTDDTHATVTVTQIKVTLWLKLTIWVPTDVTQHVSEHEEGHREISEYYYRTADNLAQRIAANNMGKQVNVTGTDLNAESSKALQQIGAEITGEYGKQLDPQPTQLLYDSITDHSRNEVVAKDAATHAIKNTLIESAQPASSN
jgi:hypothetical protein